MSMGSGQTFDINKLMLNPVYWNIYSDVGNRGRLSPPSYHAKLFAWENIEISIAFNEAADILKRKNYKKRQEPIHCQTARQDSFTSRTDPLTTAGIYKQYYNVQETNSVTKESFKLAISSFNQWLRFCDALLLIMFSPRFFNS